MDDTLAIITTALSWTTELEATIASTNHCEIGKHVVCLAFGSPYSLQREWGTLTVIVRDGCSISEGFNAAAVEAGLDSFLLVLNEGDIYVSAKEALALLRADETLDAVVGAWTCEGRYCIGKRRFSIRNLVCHGLGFSHSAILLQRGFHARFGLYPVGFKICMDFALFLDACKAGLNVKYIETVMVHIEKPGVSARILKTATEHRRAVAAIVGNFIATLLFLKWVSASLIARAVHAMRRPRPCVMKGLHAPGRGEL